MKTTIDKSTEPVETGVVACDASPNRRNILVVDDEMQIRKFIRIVLEEQEFQVFEAHDAQAALSMIAVKNFDLVISDICMPGLTGIELLKEVRRQQAGVPVLLVTGIPGVDDAVECMRLGAVEYLPKPIDMDRFYSTIADIFDTGEELLVPDSPGDQPNDDCYIGEYKILSTLGEGFNGVVFQVEKTDENGQTHQYALKLLRYTGNNDAADRLQTKRFFREIETLAKIDHPNIVKTHDYGYAENPRLPYFVMDYIRGRSLKLVSKGLVPATIAEKAGIIRQLADALCATHAQDICHRDIKPDNILVLPDLTAKLMDYSVAQLPDSELTIDEELLGSPAYISPEGFLSGKIDNRGDLFSLGAVAYELFLGDKAYKGLSFADFATAVCREKPYEPRHVIAEFPIALQSILARLLKKKIEDRYQCAEDLVRDLDICLQADELEALPAFEGYEDKGQDWEV
ncbi:MAG: protein kinase [Lentisphaeria bacterium]|jgi:DNA-binding response OmpR family regulator|nr:protein kinase [Lentisphaeria bacterium]